MFIEDWNSFYEQAENLYKSDPLKTRYVLKYVHKSAKLVLKVTDDKVCLQYKTDQQSDVKKVEKLNNLFFGLMAKGGEEEPEEPAADGDVEMAEASHAAEPASKKLANDSHKRQGALQHTRSQQRGSKARMSRA